MCPPRRLFPRRPQRHQHGMGRAEHAEAQAGGADAAVDDHPGAVDAVDAGALAGGEGILAEEGAAVGPADLAAVGVAGEADIGAGGGGGIDQVGVVEEHEFEIGGGDAAGAEGQGDVGVDAAVLVDADEGEAGFSIFIPPHFRFLIFRRAIGMRYGKALASVFQEDDFILEEDARAALGIRGLGQGGAEFNGVVISQDEVGAEARGEGFEQALQAGQRGFPLPRAMAQITGDHGEIGIKPSERGAPTIQPAGPARDMEVGEVQEREAVKGAGQALTGKFQAINMRAGEHRRMTPTSSTPL